MVKVSETDSTNKTPKRRSEWSVSISIKASLVVCIVDPSDGLEHSVHQDQKPVSLRRSLFFGGMSIMNVHATTRLSQLRQESASEATEFCFSLLLTTKIDILLFICPRTIITAIATALPPYRTNAERPSSLSEVHSIKASLASTVL